MPPSDNLITRLTRRPDPLPDLPPAEETVELEAADPRTGARPVPSVTFIDQEGRP